MGIGNHLVGGRLNRSPLNRGIPLMGAAPQELYVDFVRFIDTGTNVTNTYSFTETVGPGGIAKSPDRTIVVVAFASDGASTEGDMPNWCTINGFDMTKVVGVEGGASENEQAAAMFVYQDTGLVTATISAFYDEGLSSGGAGRVRGGFAIYNVGYAQSAIPHYVNIDYANGAVTTSSIDVQIAPGEKGILFFSSQANVEPTITGGVDTGGIVDFDTGKSAGDGNSVYGCWRIDTGSLGGGGGGVTDSGSIQVTTGASSERNVKLVAVWKPSTATADTGFTSGIRRVVYVGQQSSAANQTSYTYSNADIGPLAGAGEQKTLFLASMCADNSGTPDVIDTGMISVGGVQPQFFGTRAINNSTVDLYCAHAFIHTADTGTTADIVLVNPSNPASVGTRNGYTLWAIYHDSGYQIQIHDTGASDSGDAEFRAVGQKTESYILHTSQGYDQGPWISDDLCTRYAVDIETGDYHAAYDNGDRADGTLFRQQDGYGDTGYTTGTSDYDTGRIGKHDTGLSTVGAGFTGFRQINFDQTGTLTAGNLNVYTVFY